jgi:hypothetical protein
VKAAVADSLGDGRSEKATEAILGRLPDRFTEAELVELVEMGGVPAHDRGAELGPSVPHVEVTGEERTKLEERLDRFFEGNFREGFHSFKQAFVAFTGIDPYRIGDEDFNRVSCCASRSVSSYDSTRRMTESASVDHLVEDPR